MLWDEIKNQENSYEEIDTGFDEDGAGVSILFPYLMYRGDKGQIEDIEDRDKAQTWYIYAGISLLEDAEEIYQKHKEDWDFILLDNETGLTYSFEAMEEKNED